jgi:hypothetical protein
MTDHLPILELDPADYVAFVVLVSGAPSFWSVGPAENRQDIEGTARAFADAANRMAQRKGYHVSNPAIAHEVRWTGRDGAA